jgi:hypothetical protein
MLKKNLSVHFFLVYSTAKLQDFIKQLIMASQLLSFIACAMERDPPFPWSTQLLAIFLAVLLLSAGIVVVLIRRTTSHFYFLWINRQNIVLIRIMIKLSNAFQILVLCSVMTSLYKTTQTRTRIVIHMIIVRVVNVLTICLLLQVKANLYWQMAKDTSKLLRLKYT